MRDNGFSRACPSGNVMVEMMERDMDRDEDEVDQDTIDDEKYHARKDDQ